MRSVCLAVCLVAFGVLPAWGQDPAVTVKVTTDPNGGDGLAELPTGASSVYIFAEGTGSIDGFIFDPEPSGTSASARRRPPRRPSPGVSSAGVPTCRLR